MAPEPASEPGVGRVFRDRRRVRLADSSPGGRMRLDAVARALQDIATDDVDDARVEAGVAWVVRRTLIRVERFPAYREWMQMSTWCSGLGSRWAARRTTLLGERGSRIDTESIWVRVHPETMRPLELSDDFRAVYADAAGARKVSARLVHPPQPPTGQSVQTMEFPLRFGDFDVMEHVNNAVVWSVVEEHLAIRRELRAPLEAVVEHRAPIDSRVRVDVKVVDELEGFDVWVHDSDSGALGATAQVRSLPTGG